MSELVASAEATFAVGDYDATLDQLGRLEVAALPIQLLDRAIPLLLKSAAVERGDTHARNLLAELERALRCRGPVVAAILTSLVAEACEDPQLREPLARDALTVLRRTDEAPIALHRTLTLVIDSRADGGNGRDVRLPAEAENHDPPTRAARAGIAAPQEAATVSLDSVLAVLTGREREVALAATQGASNRMIAQNCYTSVRTVETQLSSVYRKLGIRSRHQLAALLAKDM